jgi:hypothetical protein
MRPTNSSFTGRLASARSRSPTRWSELPGVKIPVGTPFGMIDSGRFHTADA